MEARPIQGTDEDPASPFFSPSGDWVGYFSTSDSQLKKISTIGGAAVTLGDATNPFGASWGSDDTILYGQPEGVMRVSANGGTPELLVPTEASEQVHGPQMLPGGEWVLFTLTSAGGGTRWDEAQIVVQSLESDERKVLWEGGSDARYVPTGHLVYALEDVLFALPFDLASLEVSGGPVPIVEGIRRSSNPSTNTATAHYGFSDRGALIYVAGAGTGGVSRSLVVVDAEGDAVPLTDELRDYFRLRLSPDGRRVAVEVTAAGGTHIWIVDTETGIGSQLTFEGSSYQFPTWTADSQTVVFQRDGEALYKKAADGSGEQELVFQKEKLSPRPTDVSPDGVLAFYMATGEAGGRDIWTLQLEDGSASEFLATPAGESMAMFSADGQWLAYVSNQSGQNEVYVRPYPEGGQRLISDGGGLAPIWSRKGQELYYRSLSGTLMAVPIQTSPSFVPGRLRELFPVAAGFRVSTNTAAYDIDVSGEGFIMVLAGETLDGASSQQIHVVLNWFEELKERVPVP
jgi:Tol biopolymer transport system component